MARKNLINQSGQTAIEYIFMVAIMVSIITSIFSLMKTKYLGSISNCKGSAAKTQFLCRINGILSDTGDSNVGKKFQYYRFRK